MTASQERKLRICDCLKEGFKLQPKEVRVILYFVIQSIGSRCQLVSTSQCSCGANDAHYYIYDRGSNRQSGKIQAHEDDVNTVFFDNETTHVVASGADDGLCKVWDRALQENDPQPVRIFADNSSFIKWAFILLRNRTH